MNLGKHNLLQQYAQLNDKDSPDHIFPKPQLKMYQMVSQFKHNVSRLTVKFLKRNLQQKVQEMKFKTSQFSNPQFEENSDNLNATLPEQRSSILNDTNSSLRSFIQNLRNIVGAEEEQQSEGLIVLFGIDEETGNLSLGIAKHQFKKTETNLQKYKDRIMQAVTDYQHDQTSILHKCSKSLEQIAKNKVMYSNWKQKSRQSLILNYIHQGFINLIDYPRLNKQRSPSNDTAQTFEQENDYIQVPNEEPIDPLYELDQSLMEVQ